MIELLSEEDWTRKQIEHFKGDRENRILNTNKRRYIEYANRQRQHREAFERLQREVEALIYKRTHQIQNIPSTLRMSEAQAKAFLSESWRDE